MIDDIVERILTEARSTPGTNAASKIYAVLAEVCGKTEEIVDKLRDEERRKKEDENKG